MKMFHQEGACDFYRPGKEGDELEGVGSESKVSVNACLEEL